MEGYQNLRENILNIVRDILLDYTFLQIYHNFSCQLSICSKSRLHNFRISKMPNLFLDRLFALEGTSRT
jgi:hypothetical protein